MEQCLEAAGVEAAPAVEHRNSQEQLQDGKVHRMGVHGKEVRQRQRRQAEGQHLSHRHVEQSHGEDGCRDQLIFFPAQFRRFGVFEILGGDFFMFGVKRGTKARFLHLGDDLFRRDLRFVIGNGHDAGGQVYVTAVHARQLPGDPLHRGAACGAVHAGDVVFFLSHGSLLGLAVTPGGYFPNGWSIYPLGVFVKPCFKQNRENSKKALTSPLGVI